jgi:hypothetical protein
MARAFVTDNAFLLCTHKQGQVKFQASQDYVRIEDRLVLVDPDTVGKGISGCKMTIPGATVACSATLPLDRGPSPFVFIDHKPVLLEDLSGLTVCIPPGSARYTVHAGQNGQGLVWHEP